MDKIEQPGVKRLNLFSESEFQGPQLKKRLDSIEELLTQEEVGLDLEESESEDEEWDEAENFELIALYTDSTLYSPAKPKIELP